MKTKHYSRNQQQLPNGTAAESYFSSNSISKNLQIHDYLKTKAIFTMMMVAFLFLGSQVALGQTYYNMSSANYSEGFTSWTSPASGTNWSSVAVLATGSVPSATKTTVSSATFTSGTSGGLQNGSTNIQFLSTSATTNSTAVAFDLNLNFTGRNAGNLSFNTATVNNGTGDRVASLKVYYSIDGTTWTELTGTNLPYVATNNVAGSASVSIALPSVLNNQATVKLRFYNYNGSAAGTGGSRPKISIDNVSVTSTVGTTPVVNTTAPTVALSTIYGTPSSADTFSVSGSDLASDLTVTAPSGFEVSTSLATGYGNSVVLTPSSGVIGTTTLYIRLSASATVLASPYSGNIVCTTTGLSPINIATVSSSVSQKEISVTGISIANKLFDFTTDATITGTASLSGVLAGDTSNVVLGGAPSAAFTSSAIGTAIPVTVTGYSISGSASGNYSLTQPAGLTADITASATPTITSTLTHSATYGTVASTYSITASDSPTSFSATGLPAGLSLNTSTGDITGTPTDVPNTYNVSISASNGAGAGTVATLVYTVLAKELTVSSASATSKEYDRTTSAVITGTLTGVYGSDNVTLTGGGTFDTKNVGTGKLVTSALSLSGTDVSKYTLTQPTGLTADITAKALTVTTPVAQNKPYDGNTNAVITGTLSGIISPDVVTFSGIGTFASSAIGTGISVTSTSTIGGTDVANYTLTQPTGLTANITSAPTVLVAGDVAIVGINSAAPDKISIVLLKDISTGTVINFTDNGFTGTDTTGRTGEGFLTFTAPSDLPYGTVLTWTNGMTVTGTGWSSGAPSNFALSSTDQLFVFQGATANWASQSGIVLLFGVNFGTALNGTSASSNTLQPNASILPATAFLNMPSSVNQNGYFANANTAATTVNVCGSASSVLAQIVTPTKWFGTSSTASTFPTLTVLAVCPPPAITVSGTLSALSTTYGTASSNTSFTVSGLYLTNNISIAAPAGFEVSTSAASGFASSITLTQTSGTVLLTTIYVRLATTTAAGTYSGDVVVSSTDATSQNVATVSSVVNQKELTITGIAIANKLFDGNTDATITGAPVLNGVIPADAANVTLGGTPVATFASSAVGTGIAVTISGYSISGTAIGNYSFTQPSGLTADITSVPSPVISSALTFSSVYGTVASTYTITATETPSSYNATSLPTGLSINTTTGEITGTPTVAPGNYNVTVSATNDGGTGSATLVYTITAKELTVSGAVASNKAYNGNTTAFITGTLDGIYGTDVVTISGGGTFDNKNIGTAKPVTATITLAGANAVNYTVTQPTGLTADITPRILTISGAQAQNKVYDGNTNAVITGTLSNVISGEDVAYLGTGVFASSAIGNGIAVTSTITLSGLDIANYTLTQPTGLTASITEPVLYSNVFTGAAACPTQGNTSTVVTNTTSFGLSRSTITCNATANVFNSTTLNNTATVSNTSYIEFSVSATSGHALKVGSMSFFRQASASAPNQLEVRYSTDNFVTSSTWTAPLTPTSGTVATWDFTDFVTSNDGTVKFRFYPYGTQRADLSAGSSASGSFRLDDVTVYGTVVSPSSAAIISGDATICNGASTDLSVAITGGQSPYTIVYNDGTSNTTVANYVSGSPISITPTANSTYTLVSVTDAYSLVGTGNTGLAVVTVNDCTVYSTSLLVSATIPPSVTPGKYLYAIGITLPSGSSITNYEYEVTNLTSNMVGTYQTTNNYFRLLDVPGIAQYYTTYTVRVKLQVNGVWQPYGIVKNVNTNVLSSVAMSGAYCGTTLSTITKTIGCTLVPIATSYIFEVTDVATSAVSTYTSSTNLFSLINLATDSFPIKFNHQYSVRVQYTALVDGETITSAFSSACTITTPVGDPVPTIISPACNSVVSYAGSLVRSTYVASASEYRFDLASASASHSLSGRTVNNFSFSLIDGYVSGTLYGVTPWVKLYGVWYEGTTCNLTSPGTATVVAKGEVNSNQQISSAFAVKAYPNPFAENFKLNVTSSVEGALQVKVYDMLGKLVEKKELNVSDIETLEVGTNYPSGVYNVVVSQGENVQSLRVIKR